MTLAAEAQIFHDGYFSTRFVLFKGDCAEVLSSLESNSAASLVTDPPAGIAFMGKDWDKDRGGRAAWVAWMTEVMRECLRVLKPGAHGLVWSLPRTSHWAATALEDAGFEVRDCITHLFGTGFPKSLDVSKAIDKAAGAEREVVATRKLTGKARVLKGGNFDGSYEGRELDSDYAVTAPATDAARQWSGWGTALKPAAEFWWLVRKPLGEKTVAANVLKHGTGGINVDAGRIGTDSVGWLGRKGSELYDSSNEGGVPTGFANGGDPRPIQGRFPANVVLSHSHECGDACAPDCAVRMLDEQSGTLTSGARIQRGDNPETEQPCGWKTGRRNPAAYDASVGGASRFFYCAKSSRSDRGGAKRIDNKHPTVKSTQLMRYLIKLITPPDGIVLDPFMGSGTTGVSALPQGFRFIGIEQDETSFHTAKRRLCKTPYRG